MRNVQDEVGAALSVSVPASRLPLETLGPVAVLKQRVNDIAKQLGWSGYPRGGLK